MNKVIIFLLALVPVFCFAQIQTGFFDFEITDKGKVMLHLSEDKIDYEFLYVNSLAAGLGSNDIGLDRGQLGGTQVVKFIKSGNKILLIQPNLKYRAISDNEKEVRAVQEAFAESVLWGFDLKDQTADIKIDITPFLMRDAHDVSGRLKSRKEGTYKLDQSKSTIWEERTINFPNNSEFESMLTFTGAPTGKYVRSVAPNAKNLTVRQHHSFIELPDDKYKPRVYHPYSAYNTVSYFDYATPIDEPIEKRYIARHRLEKKNPEAAISEAVEPIIYYIDAGCPEPVKSALMHGARWWDQAFQAAGFAEGTFQVKDLPEGANPLDVRYNMIQWVHRSTRGWSYGASVRDPRTGEIIKGHVSLGSLRVRQDYMIAQALFSPFRDSDSNTGRMKDLALARLNQLAAHEVGHTIGLVHNFAASHNDRASVMDYPHPLFEMQNDGIKIQKAYDDKIGDWDKFTIQYGYSQFNSDKEEELGLQKLVDEVQQKGLKFISDRDARPAGGSHPLGHLWDNGKDVIDELDRLMDMRKKSMSQFGENTIQTGTPYSELEKVFVPLYYLHRYQAEAVSKIIGGVEFNYSVKGDKLDNTVKPVSLSNQNRAIDGLLNSMDADHLKVPQNVLSLIPPPAQGYSKSRESFPSNSGSSFDPIAAAESYVDFVLSFMLNPQRLSRINQHNIIHNTGLSLNNYLTKIDNSLGAPQSDSYAKALSGSAQIIFVNQLMKLALDNSIDKHVASTVFQFVQNKSQNTSAYISQMIESAFDDPAEYKWPVVKQMPPGSPIGCYQESVVN